MFVVFLRLMSGSALVEEVFDQMIAFDIPENTPLEEALIEWGTKAGMTVMINTQMVDAQPTLGVQGNFTAGQALPLLLRDTGLTHTRDGEGYPSCLVNSSADLGTRRCVDTARPHADGRDWRYRT
jgi:hypothetical protein